MEDKKLSIELSVTQWNVVMAALGKMPLEAAIDTFVAIRAQADAALKAPSE